MNGGGRKLFNLSLCDLGSKSLKEFIKGDGFFDDGEKVHDAAICNSYFLKSKIVTGAGIIESADIFVFDTLFQGKKASLNVFPENTFNQEESEATLQSEFQLRMFAEKYPSGALFIVDDHFRIYFTGGQELKKIGFSNSDLEDKIIYDVLPVKQRQLFKSFLRDLFNCKHNIYEI